MLCHCLMKIWYSARSAHLRINTQWTLNAVPLLNRDLILSKIRPPTAAGPPRLRNAPIWHDTQFEQHDDAVVASCLAIRRMVAEWIHHQLPLAITIHYRQGHGSGCYSAAFTSNNNGVRGLWHIGITIGSNEKLVGKLSGRALSQQLRRWQWLQRQKQGAERPFPQLLILFLFAVVLVPLAAVVNVRPDCRFWQRQQETRTMTTKDQMMSLLLVLVLATREGQLRNLHWSLSKTSY